MEHIYNLYAIVEDDTIEKVGIVSYPMKGSDREKEKFLKGRAARDFSRSEIYPVPYNYVIFDFNGPDINGIPYPAYKKMARSNEIIGIFETALADKKAPLIPCVNYAVVKKGKVIKIHD